MKKQLFVLCLVAFVTGCGRAAFHQRTVRDGSEVVSSSTYHRDRYGDVDSKEDVDIGNGGYGYGSPLGGPMVFPPQPPVTYQLMPVVTDGQRIEETLPGGIPVLIPSDVDTRQSERLRLLYEKMKEQEARLNALDP
jgi:hypothetical protein